MNRQSFLARLRKLERRLRKLEDRTARLPVRIKSGGGGGGEIVTFETVFAPIPASGRRIIHMINDGQDWGAAAGASNWFPMWGKFTELTGEPGTS